MSNLIGQNIFGYEVAEFIASGSFGYVYKVKKNDITGEYIRALKHIKVPANLEQYNAVLSSCRGDSSKAREYFENSLKSILNEIQILNNLSEKGTPNIVRYYDHKIIKSEDENSINYDIYILMEYLTSLKKHFQNNDFKVTDVCRLGIDVLTALDICHKTGIIHRDIKEDNIFIRPNGTFVLGDFGISKILKHTEYAETKRMGSYTYMAPEVYLGKECYNKSVDLYSLGIVLYRLLNDFRNPFCPQFPSEYTISDEEKAFEHRIKGEIPDLPYYGGDILGQIVVKSISSYTTRFNSAENFLLTLRNAVLQIQENVLNDTVLKKITFSDSNNLVKSVNKFSEETVKDEMYTKNKTTETSSEEKVEDFLKTNREEKSFIVENECENHTKDTSSQMLFTTNKKGFENSQLQFKKKQSNKEKEKKPLEKIVLLTSISIIGIISLSFLFFVIQPNPLFVTAYIFSFIGIVINLFTNIYLLKDIHKKNFSWTIEIPLQSNKYLFFNVVIGIFFVMLSKIKIFNLPVLWFLVLQIFLLAFFSIRIILLNYSKKYIEDIDKNLEVKTDFINKSADMLEKIYLFSPNEYKIYINNLAKTIKYSDPVSHSKLENLEIDIILAIQNLSEQVTNNNFASIKNGCEKVSILIKERNQKLKRLK